jgi:hypothetical protein
MPTSWSLTDSAFFAKHIVWDKNASEETFLQTSFTQLQALGIQPKKMMAGLKRKISMPEGAIHTRSLMIADLRKAESVKLQEVGIGKHRLLGCGLFLGKTSMVSAPKKSPCLSAS